MSSNFTTGDSNVSVLYWPDLGSMSLNPQFAAVSPDVVMNQGNLPLFCFDPANHPSTPAIHDKPNQTLLSMRLKAQQDQAIIAMKMNSFGSPFSPLSPQDSVGASENSLLLFRNNGSVPTDGPVQSVGPSSYGETPSANGRDVQIPDFPTVPVLPVSQIAARLIRSRVPSKADSLRTSKMRQDPLLVESVDYGENEESKRLKRTLEDLERELMDDDEEQNFICQFGLSEPSIRAGAPEKGWMGFIEDFLRDGSAIPTPALGSSTMALKERSPVSSAGNIGSSNQGKEVIIQASSGAQVHTLAAQSSQASADVKDQPKHLLISCATAVAENNYDLARNIVTKLKEVSSVYGDPMQRLAAYMTVGLVARIEKSVRGPCEDFRSMEPLSKDKLCALQVLYRVCPYLRFSYLAANGAIAEAFKDEDKVHIIDFEIRQGNQWVTLIKALGARPGGPPQVRITGVQNPLSPRGGSQSVGTRLEELAQSVGLPFEFHLVAMTASEVKPWMLHKRPGEALAVNFAYQLQHMPDESVCTSNPRDGLLRMVRAMEPKVVTVVEQEANVNTTPFIARFLETLSYYGAFFESLDLPLRGEIRDLVNIEQQLLASVIVNIIAYEDAERVERYELHGKWRWRMTTAGFRPFPLCSHINNTIKSLLRNYPSNYRLKEEEGALFLGWLDRDLIVASAWH